MRSQPDIPWALIAESMQVTPARNSNNQRTAPDASNGFRNASTDKGLHDSTAPGNGGGWDEVPKTDGVTIHNKQRTAPSTSV